MIKPHMSISAMRRAHKMGEKEAWHEYNRRGMHGPQRRESDVNGAYLKLWRKSRGLSQEQLAGWLLTNQSSVSQWERGICNPPSNLGELLRDIDRQRGTPEEQMASVLGTPTLKEQPESDSSNTTELDIFRITEK